MQYLSFDDILDKIVREDPRYSREAYLFVREALDYTQKSICQKEGNKLRQHVSGKELLEGIREYALSQYGPMTVTLLEEWGITCCEDIGEIVFNLVDHGLLNKTDSDTRQDFKEGYDFEEAFRKPFRPKIA